jgi:hypothetical protein
MPPGNLARTLAVSVLRGDGAGFSSPRRQAMSEMTLTHDDLNVALSEVLTQCARKGMRRPFVVVAISPNGSVTAMRTGHGTCETLVNHIEGDGPAYPITVLVLDQDNQAVKLTVTAQEKIWQ